MTALKAKVQDGRLVLNEPTDLPEGTEVELFPSDGWDSLDPEDRKRLHEALAASEDDIRSGRVRPVDDLLEELRQAVS